MSASFIQFWALFTNLPMVWRPFLPGLPSMFLKQPLLWGREGHGMYQRIAVKNGGDNKTVRKGHSWWLVIIHPPENLQQLVDNPPYIHDNSGIQSRREVVIMFFPRNMSEYFRWYPMPIMSYSMQSLYWWWENLQETPIFDGINHGFL